MNSEKKAPLIPHEPPKPFPSYHYIGLAVPLDFARVVSEVAAKNKRQFDEQLLEWAQIGAECSRLHQAKTAGRKNRK